MSRFVDSMPFELSYKNGEKYIVDQQERGFCWGDMRRALVLSGGSLSLKEAMESTGATRDDVRRTLAQGIARGAVGWRRRPDGEQEYYLKEE